MRRDLDYIAMKQIYRRWDRRQRVWSIIGRLVAAVVALVAIWAVLCMAFLID